MSDDLDARVNFATVTRLPQIFNVSSLVLRPRSLVPDSSSTYSIGDLTVRLLLFHTLTRLLES